MKDGLTGRLVEAELLEELALLVLVGDGEEELGVVLVRDVSYLVPPQLRRYKGRFRTIQIANPEITHANARFLGCDI